jgi:hypothetical protein
MVAVRRLPERIRDLVRERVGAGANPAAGVVDDRRRFVGRPAVRRAQATDPGMRPRFRARAPPTTANVEVTRVDVCRRASRHRHVLIVTPSR